MIGAGSIVEVGLVKNNREKPSEKRVTYRGGETEWCILKPWLDSPEPTIIVSNLN